MRFRFALMIFLALATLLLSAPISTAHATETWQGRTSEKGVRLACKGKLQSGGGVIGCTKPCGSDICDWSCGGPQGPDCRVVVFPSVRVQESEETKSPLGDQPLVQSGEGDNPVAEKLLQVYLNASKGEVVRACTDVKGITLTETKAVAGYGCYNPKKDVLVACLLKAEDCVAYMPKKSRFETLRGILGANSATQDNDSLMSSGRDVIYSP